MSAEEQDRQAFDDDTRALVQALVEPGEDHAVDVIIQAMQYLDDAHLALIVRIAGSFRVLRDDDPASPAP